MKSATILAGLLLLAGCVNEDSVAREAAFGASIRNCGGAAQRLPSTDFYDVAGKTIQGVHGVYGCVKQANPDIAPTLDMQQSLWLQVLERSKTPAQAQEAYLLYVQKNETTAEMVRATRAAAFDRAAVYRGAGPCIRTGPFLDCRY